MAMMTVEKNPLPTELIDGVIGTPGSTYSFMANIPSKLADQQIN